MSLWIMEGTEVDVYSIVRDLNAIAHHSQLNIEIGYDSAAQKRKSGRVTFANQGGDVGDTLVAQLVASPCVIGIRGEPATYTYAKTSEGTLADVGGVVVYDRYPNPTGIVVVYDPTDCGGWGSWVLDAQGNHIPFPTRVALYHELAHALHLATGVYNAAHAETMAIDEENRFRAAEGLRARAGHQGGCNPPATPTPTTPTSDCFVATAAYGSPLAPEVDLLRGIRDNLLRRTRSGAAFFDRFYARYNRFSPALVRLMDDDPEVRDLVRWALVTPIVEYLRLVRDFPDASLADVPEPWRGFLLETRSRLEGWAEPIPLPVQFAGMEPVEAATEIGVVLRYLLRTDERRQDYLARLERLQQIPLRSGPGERSAARRALLALDRPAAEIDRVLGTRGAPSAQPPAGSPPLLAARGSATEVIPRGEFSMDDWLYTVTVRNATSATFDAVDLFYKRKDLPGVVFLQEENVAPNDVRVFNLGVCSRLDSYVFACFLDGEMVARIPAPGQNMTPALASALNPTDLQPCEDSWAIDTQWEMTPPPLEYRVNVANLTPDTFSEITLFYSQRGQSDLVMVQASDVGPNAIHQFDLGPAELMESYAFAGFITDQYGEYEAFRFPPQGQGVMTPQRASEVKPSDTDPYMDSWTVG